MAIKAIFFDFWGTLVENGIRSPVKQVKWDLRLTDTEFSDYIVKFEEVFMTKEFEDLKQGFEEVAKAFNIDAPDYVIEKLIGMWNKNSILAKPYDETMGVLEELKKDYKLILICNTDSSSVNSVLEKFDMKKYFDVIALSCETGLLKSNKKSFSEALKKLKIKKSEAVMVGDSMESDVKGAENAKIKAILVDRNEKREYENKILNLNELKDKLK